MTTYTKDTSSKFITNFRDNTSGVEQTPQPSWNLKRVLVGERLPNYNVIISQGLSATTPLDAEEQSVPVFAPNRVTWFRSGYAGPEWSTRFGFPSVFPQMGGTFGNFPEASASLQNAAHAQALKYYNAEIHQYKSPLASQVFLGEIRETIRFLVHPLRTLRELHDALYVRWISYDKLPRGASRSKALANLWLESRFAVLPLVNDINAALRILDERHERHDFVKAYGKAETSTLTNESISGYTVTHKNEVIRTTRVESFIKASILLELLDTNQGLYEYLTSDFANTAQTAQAFYEIAPLSWLLDYLVNIGDIIGALAQVQTKTNFTSWSLVTTQVEQRTWKGFASAVQSYSLQYADPPYYRAQWRKVKRRELGSTVPPLTFMLPLGTVQVANTLAFLIQRIKH